MDSKLTITIPTYNRPEQICSQVRRLLPQLRKGVSLVVRDNCSDQPVESLFTEDELKLFSIERNKVNIGGDANIAACITNVDEGWVWPLSDDDVITNNAVEIILTEISNHYDCCYINFQAKKEEETKGLDETLEHLKIMGAFGVSFFISDCVFNIDQMKKSLFWYYNFLSTKMGQIFMVVKHLELNNNAKCFFSKKSYIKEVPAGNWNPMLLIINSSSAVDKFYYCRKNFRTTLFVALANLYLTLLILNEKTIIGNWFFFIHVVKKFGLINLIRRNSKLFFGYLGQQIIPKRIFAYVKAKTAQHYNEKISK